MLSRQTLKRHAGLVDRMADRQSLDLEELALRGAITISEIDDAVLRCTGCSNADGCERMLVAEAGQSGPAPDYCRNLDLFDRLARA